MLGRSLRAPRNSLAYRPVLPLVSFGGSIWGTVGQTDDQESDSRGGLFLMQLASVVVGTAALVASSSTARCYTYDTRPDGSVDRLGRWSARPWNLPYGVQPGWQLDGPHPTLQRHLKRFLEGVQPDDIAIGPTVLVPLCGKADDMPFLCARGFGVVGIEGVGRAIYEFREENANILEGFYQRMVLSPNADGSWCEGIGFQAASAFSGPRANHVFRQGPHGLGYYVDSPSVWRGQIQFQGREPRCLDILQGDMFEVTPELIAAATFVSCGRFDFAFDRAAVVSIPPEAREQYVSVMDKLLKARARLLLVVEDYDQSLVPVDTLGRRRGPPPFAMRPDEVRRLFPASKWTVEELERVPSDLPHGGNVSFHCLEVWEVVYLITKTSSDG